MTGLCLWGVVGAGSLACVARLIVDYITLSSSPRVLVPITQYADIGPESATNRARFRPGPVLGRHPVLGGGIGSLRQLGAEPAY
jgi:hypothetical protein